MRVLLSAQRLTYPQRPQKIPYIFTHKTYHLYLRVSQGTSMTALLPPAGALRDRKNGRVIKMSAFVNCVYSLCDRNCVAAWAGEPLLPRCANHPAGRPTA
jgi:hypothetical protein